MFWTRINTVVRIINMITGCAASNNPLRKEIELLQKGIVKDDTSYVYALPKAGKYRVDPGLFQSHDP